MKAYRFCLFYIHCPFHAVYKFDKVKDEQDKEFIANTYLNNIEAINNWDLVDSSGSNIL